MSVGKKNSDVSLGSIVGSENVSRDLDILSHYFREPIEQSGLQVVYPGSVEEVQGIARLATKDKIPIYTINDQYLRQEVAKKGGILLDFKRMNKIERVDSKNLVVHVQRGVTFPELIAQLKKHKVRTMLPAAATSRSVLCNFVNRAVMQAAAR